MIPIEIAIGILLLLAAACYCIGFRHGHQIGDDTGWDAGYAFRDSASEIRWQITASGKQALNELKESGRLAQHHKPQTSTPWFLREEEPDETAETQSPQRNR